MTPNPLREEVEKIVWYDLKKKSTDSVYARVVDDITNLSQTNV